MTNFVKIDAYNFEPYRFKVGAFFLRHSVERVSQLMTAEGRKG